MLTQNDIKNQLHYSSETGIFTRLIAKCNSVKIGDIAGSKHIKGYLQLSVNGKPYLAHRLAWFYVHGIWPIECIDHINGIKTDNRILNLREATFTQNKHNYKKANSDNKTSKLLGVSWSKTNKSWVSQISLNNKLIYIGHFSDKHKAHEAYLRKKREIHPFTTL